MTQADRPTPVSDRGRRGHARSSSSSRRRGRCRSSRPGPRMPPRAPRSQGAWPPGPRAPAFLPGGDRPGEFLAKQPLRLVQRPPAPRPARCPTQPKVQRPVASRGRRTRRRGRWHCPARAAASMPAWHSRASPVFTGSLTNDSVTQARVYPSACWAKPLARSSIAVTLAGAPRLAVHRRVDGVGELRPAARAALGPWWPLRPAPRSRRGGT